MQKNKNIFQKISFVVGVISFLLSLASIIGFYLKVQSQGMNDPVSVAFLATTFFFISVGVVLVFISKMNIPSFDMQIEPQKKG